MKHPSGCFVVLIDKLLNMAHWDLSIPDVLGPRKFVLIIQVQSAISTYGIILVPDNLVLIIEDSLIWRVC